MTIPRYATRLRAASRLCPIFLAFAGLTVAPAAPQPAAAQPTASPLTLCGQYEDGDPESVVVFDLENGRGELLDRLQRDPRQLRRRPLESNLFTLFGRPTDQPARPGEIFFQPLFDGGGDLRSVLYVETPIGYAAYLGPVKGNRFEEITTLTLRPFESIAATDGQFVLLPRQARSGETIGVVLYHATTGRALYLAGLDELEISPEVRPVEGLPSLGRGVAAASLHAGSRATASYLVLSSGSGKIVFFDTDANRPEILSPRESTVDLAAAFPAPEGEARRILALAIHDNAKETPRVFLADPASGRIAVLDDVLGDTPTMKPASLDLGAWLAGSPGPHHLAALPDVRRGETIGLWLFDNVTQSILYIENPGSPAEMTASPVLTARP